MKLEIMPTLKCNLACVGCDRGFGKPGPLVVDDLVSFDIVDVVASKMGNIDAFVVSGGEPTCYPKLVPLLDHLRLLRNVPVNVKTNGFKMLALPVQVVLRNTWSVSMYQENTNALHENAGIFNSLIRMGCVEINKITYFEDLDSLTHHVNADFDPTMFCFAPTLIGNLDCIYPCCRAHRFERKTGNKYSIHVDDFSVLALRDIITQTDLCSLCPRKMGSERLLK